MNDLKMGDSLTHNLRLYALKLCLSGICAFLLFVLFILLLPSMFWSVIAGPQIFTTLTVHEISSPEKQYRIVVQRRIHFPVIAIFNTPSAEITVLLKNADDLTLQTASFDIHESSELQEPVVQWSNNEVAVEDIEYHQEIGLRFRLPQQ